MYNAKTSIKNLYASPLLVRSVANSASEMPNSVPCSVVKIEYLHQSIPVAEATVALELGYCIYYALLHILREITLRFLQSGRRY